MDPIDERLTRAGAAWRDDQPPLDPPVLVPHGLPPDRARARIASLAGLAAVVLAGVGVLWAVSPRGSLDGAASPSPRPMALLTEETPADFCLFLRIGGVLQRDPRSGLGIVRADGTAMPVRWPFGYSAYEQAGRVVLVDDTASPVAIDGDPIAFGSAGISLGVQVACRVGLDADRPVPGEPLTGNIDRPYTEAELLALVRMRDAGRAVPEVVVADVTIDRAVEDGASSTPVLVGTVGGPDDQVIITADPQSAPSSASDHALTGTFAFVIKDTDLRLIGPVDPLVGGRYLHEVADLPTMPSDEPAVGSLIAVDGWLAISPLGCPLSAEATDGSDSARPACRAVRITDAPEDPDVALPVQDDAWRALGANPGLDVRLPRHGVYLLQRVADGTERGWAVEARLDPVRHVSMDLPTVSAWTGSCRGIGLDALLTGDASDPRVAWLVDQRGARVDVVWPPGYTARFTPLLEVVTSAGAVRLREGDHVDGGCTTGPDAAGPLLIAPAR